MRNFFFMLLLLSTALFANAQKVIKNNDTLHSTPTGCYAPFIGPFMNPSDQTTCTGLNVMFVAETGFPTGLVWQQSTDSGLTWVDIPNTNKYFGCAGPAADYDTLNIITVTISMNNYQYRCSYLASSITGGYFTVNTSAAILYINTTSIWQGIDSSWNNPANWSCNAIPDSNIVVYIPSGKAFYPVVDTTVYCKSISEDPGSSVTINTNGNLIVTGH